MNKTLTALCLILTILSFIPLKTANAGLLSLQSFPANTPQTTSYIHKIQASCANAPPDLGGNCKLVNSYGGLHGTTCVYSYCNPNNSVIICDDLGCNGAGATVGPAGPNIDVPFDESQNEGIFDEVDLRNECIGCTQPNCDAAEAVLRANHEQFERAIMSNISGEMRRHRQWLREIFFKGNLLPAMMHFTRQMSAIAMHQVFAIGQFFDTENQLTTQRAFQTLQIQAHDDYHPSESFCKFGSSVRSLAASDQKTDANQAALASAQLARHLSNGETPGLQGPDKDLASRWTRFQSTYCNPKDNNWNKDSANKDQTGLALVCGTEAPDPQRVNIDIDYLRLISEPRTLDVDFTNAATNPTETDILALSQNLYGHNLLTRQLTDNGLALDSNQELYMAMRSVAAKRRVAEDSFNAIVAMKTSGSDDMEYDPQNPQPNTPQTSKYLYELLEELGVSNTRSDPNEQSDIEKLIGKNPSYYAQLEILAKRIYQNTDFYVNLYDKPANIKRKAAALLAIERMLDQAILESQWRQEMAMSVLLSSSMKQEWQKIQRELSN